MLLIAKLSFRTTICKPNQYKDEAQKFTEASCYVMMCDDDAKSSALCVYVCVRVWATGLVVFGSSQRWSTVNVTVTVMMT